MFAPPVLTGLGQPLFREGVLGMDGLATRAITDQRTGEHYFTLGLKPIPRRTGMEPFQGDVILDNHTALHLFTALTVWRGQYVTE
ncbi:hypothetical protein C436_20813 [Haloarcula marismortui ATCC 33800]|uniref:Uncharacterized protein n=1 Tax=Haloarcula marismortui ATCC 33800 TaxID=662476 RepID=M0JGH7_9EURY|nr:hypothetical protein C436_20813 [Haloarcula sinaiiensis ATCC 33800]